MANNGFSVQSLTISTRKLQNKLTKFKKRKNSFVETVLRKALKKADYELEKKVQKQKMNLKKFCKPLICLFLNIGLLRKRPMKLTSLDRVKMSAAKRLPVV